MSAQTMLRRRVVSLCRCTLQPGSVRPQGLPLWTNDISGCSGFSTASPSFTSAGGVGGHPRLSLRESYALLNLKDGCSSRQLKDAYLQLAKVYHPDSGSEKADAAKFSQLQQAYRAVKAQLQEGETGEAGETEEPEEPEVVFDIKHTAPQHRQYLNFDGIGFGTPAQRQRQYQQYRVAKATENVNDLRVQKIAVKYEDALVVRDKQAMKSHKTQNYMDRLVEDLIKESMEKGDFQDLAGTGKPLGYSDRNPFVDATTHNLNKILINDGFAPEWIALEREIRQEIRRCREVLAKERNYLGSPPLSAQDHKRWEHHKKNFCLSVDDINAKIHKYNMVVPFLQKQMVEYNKEKETKVISENWERFLPEAQEEEKPAPPSIYSFPSAKYEKINWVDVWRNIRAMFST